MNEPRGTTRERERRSELTLDDLIIEDISDGAAKTAAPGTEIAGVPEQIQVEELPLESIDIIEEPGESRASSYNRSGTGAMMDLEALTSEVDRIERVMPDESRPSRAPSLAGSSRKNDVDELSLSLDDFDNVQELNLDEVNTQSQSAVAEAGGAVRIKEKTQTGSETADELPYDLIDDEFLILEDEHGERMTLSVAEGTPDKSGSAESMEDELVRIGDADGSGSGSIIDENLEAGKKPVEPIPAPAVETAGKPVSTRKSGEFTIQIPEKVRKNLPGNFRISDLRPVDLNEAEKIASEDMLLLKEEDLIEELDAIDLVPLDDEPHAGELPPIEDESALEMQEEEMPAETEAPAAEESLTLIEEPAGDDISMEDRAITEKAMPVSEREPVFEKPKAIIDESEEPVVAAEERIDVPARPILLEVETGEAFADSGERAEQAIEIRELPEDEEIIPATTRGDAAEETAAKVSLEELETAEPLIIDKSAGAPPERGVIDEIVRVMVKESLPAGIAAGTGEKNIYIIDDVAVEKEIERSASIFEENDLEKITSSMVEVMEGDSKFLREASTEEDQDQIAAIMSGTALAFEDLLIDFEDEYKFSDEETGFIDGSFVSDAYREHDRSASGKDAGKLRRKETIALEIFGLTDNEITDIESGVFAREFKDIDLSRVEGAARPGLDQAPGDYDLSRKYLYLGDSAQNMNKAEKASVEEDLSGDAAVIFEENADDIRRILANYRKNRKVPSGGVRDISDEIVFIEDNGDMERFAATLPGEKKQSIKSLLKYLDGLFEKLPEDVIRKFADSEYYNLYVKVLNDLDR